MLQRCRRGAVALPHNRAQEVLLIGMTPDTNCQNQSHTGRRGRRPSIQVLNGHWRAAGLVKRGPYGVRSATCDGLTMNDELYIPPEGPPQGAGPSPEIHAKMGTENIFEMCRVFYVELEASSIRHMFSDDMPAASQRLAAFLVGACGGPPLYRELHGEPMMRKRHMPFAIDDDARRVWLSCFKRVLEDADTPFGFPAEHKDSLFTYLEDFSAWMVNRRSP